METGRARAEGSLDAVILDPLVVASYLGSDDVALRRAGAAGPERHRRVR